LLNNQANGNEFKKKNAKIKNEFKIQIAFESLKNRFTIVFD